MVCLSGTFYTMKADIYTPSKTQNSIGMVQSSWTLSSTIDCSAKTILRDTMLSGSDSVDITGQFITAMDIIKLRTRSPIDPDFRVVNIRNANGTVWIESNGIDSNGGVDDATIFEPMGSTPILDFNGSVLEYETLLRRQEVQSLVID